MIETLLAELTIWDLIGYAAALVYGGAIVMYGLSLIKSRKG